MAGYGDALNCEFYITKDLNTWEQPLIRQHEKLIKYQNWNTFLRLLLQLVNYYTIYFVFYLPEDGQVISRIMCI